MGLVALTGSLFSMPALSETLYPFISAGIDHDDNLFRLSDDQLQQRAAADTYRSVIGGLDIDRPVGRQLFTGTAKLSSVKFDHNSQLDYTGKDLKGEWHWFLAAHFEGHVGGLYSQGLASFEDFHVDQRNLRVIKKQYVDGSWRYHPSWRWRNSYTKDQYSYDLLTQRGNNRTEDAVVTGIDYLARSGSTAGFQLRRLKGNYPYQQSFAGAGFLGNGYVQEEAKVNVLWLATGSTQVLFLGGWVRRKQNAEAGRVDSGTNARLIVNWAPTGKVKLTGQAWREFAAIDGALVNSALTSGASAVATWDFTGKIQAVANLKRETRKFTPLEGASTLLSSEFSDSSHADSVGVVYKPMRNLTLKLSGFRNQRSGSVAAGTNSYKANGVSFNVSQQF